MNIFVRAKTGAREERVEKIDETHFIISVKERPTDGKANHAIFKLLATHFGLPLSHFSILSGFTHKKKVISVSI